MTMGEGELLNFLCLMHKKTSSFLDIRNAQMEAENNSA